MKYAVALFSLLTLFAAGCGSHAAVPTTAMPSTFSNQSITSIPISDEAQPNVLYTQIGIRLTNESPTNDFRYGQVLGYFRGLTNTHSQVIGLTANQNVQFYNVDSFRPHTISFLGNATSHSAPWPSSFNGSSTMSPRHTAIGTKNFSSGPVSPGGKSVVYSAGMPGFYMFGCAFHYNSNMMRTVIIVH